MDDRELVRRILRCIELHREETGSQSPATPSPPKRVWECLYPRDSRGCGMRGGKRNREGVPFGWHYVCWSAYQIKTLRGMVIELMSPQRSWRETCAQVVDQLGELYPERGSTP